MRSYPKAFPRNATKRKMGSTKILPDTLEKEELRKQKNAKIQKAKKVGETESSPKKMRVLRSLVSSNDEDMVDPPCQDESDLERKTFEDLIVPSEDDAEEIQTAFVEDISVGAHI